jgi:hypothetical protein
MTARHLPFTPSFYYVDGPFHFHRMPGNPQIPDISARNQTGDKMPSSICGKKG